jgi:hypothetical protein
MKKSAILAVLVLAVGGIGAGVATGAGKQKVKTKVTIHATGGPPATGVAGRVKAKRHGHTVKKCIKKRKVVVKHEGTKVGTDKTNKKGRYSVPIDAYSEPGDYRAIAKKKVTHNKVCKKGKSRTITL